MEVTTVFYFSLVSVIVLLVISAAALVLALTYKKSAHMIAYEPKGPTLTTETTVGSALDRLNLVATGDSNGLIMSIDRIKLTELVPTDGGVLVYAEASAATCTVSTSDGQGSGFVLAYEGGSRVLVVTAAHVVLESGGEVPGASALGNITVVVGGANNDLSINVQVSCSLVGVDRAADVAVLRTMNVADDPDAGFDFTAEQKTIAWADSDTVRPGSSIYAVGDPLGQDLRSISGGTLRDNKWISNADVTSIECIAYSCPIAPGNSGGPVLDSSAQCVGLSNFIFTGYSSFGGGVNSYMASRIVPRLVAGTNDKGFLGVREFSLVAAGTLEVLRNAYPGFAASGLDVVAGVRCLSVQDGFAAAGFLPDDILVSVNGVDVGVFDDQHSPTRGTWFEAPGTTVPVRVVRPSSPGAPIDGNVVLSVFPSSLDVVLTGAF